jgi:hypothetical protein
MLREQKRNITQKSFWWLTGASKGPGLAANQRESGLIKSKTIRDHSRKFAAKEG